MTDHVPAEEGVLGALDTSNISFTICHLVFLPVLLSIVGLCIKLGLRCCEPLPT